MKTGQTSGQKWYTTRSGSAFSAIVALLLAYLVGSRAIYTGSLQQYSITFILLVTSANRLFVACKLHPKTHRKTV